ncbi:MAG: hypothetical protein V1875_10490 [Candidatus Altiarchaeota archaeon]
MPESEKVRKTPESTIDFGPPMNLEHMKPPKGLPKTFLEPQVHLPAQFPYQTEFGRLFAPLYLRLNGLPEAEQRPSFKTFRMVWEHMEEARRGRPHGLAGLELKPEDILFILSDPVFADKVKVRRQILYGLYADKLDAAIEAKTPEQEEIKRLFVQSPRADSWKYFIKDEQDRRQVWEYLAARGLNPDHEVTVDTMETYRKRWEDALKILEKDPLYAYGIAHGMVYGVDDIFRRYADYVTDAGRQDDEQSQIEKRSPRLSEPGHAFGFIGRNPYLTEIGDTLHLKNLTVPKTLSLMVVEDDPIYRFWCYYLGFVNSPGEPEGITPYSPSEGGRRNFRDIWDHQDTSMVLGDAEAALKDVEEGIAKGRLPDIILTDIRLPGMSGLEFARKVYDRCKGAGLKPPPIITYSSDTSKKTLDEVEALMSGGIIVQHLPKQTFTVKAFVKVVNESLR